MSAPLRVLVAAHSTDATDDGLILIETVRWLIEQRGVDVRVVVARRGELTSELEALVPVMVMDELDRRSFAGLVERGLFALRLRRRAFARRAARLGLVSFAADTVYLHTVLAAQVLRCVAPRPRVVCRVQRDLEPSRWALREVDQQLLVERVDRFVAEGEVRVRELLHELAVGPERVHEVPQVIVPADPRVPRDPSAAAALRAALSLSDDTFVVGGYSPSTTADPPDLSVFVASLLTRRAQGVPLTCLWVVAQGSIEFWATHELERTGLADTVRLLDRDADLEPLFRQCDVLVHLARLDEAAPDPYLEVAADGVPLVCFSGSSLVPFVGEAGVGEAGVGEAGVGEAGIGDGGVVVPYLDVVALADGLVRLAEDPDLRRRLGAGAARRVLATYSVTRYAERLWGDLEAARG